MNSAAPNSIQQQRQPWLFTKSTDLIWIISPGIVASILVLLMSHFGLLAGEMSTWAWVVTVLFFDVSHVYASLYRTYFSKDYSRLNPGKLLAIPALVWLFGSCIYSMSGLLFWRIAAYLAVFHFIRQQYGFFALYSRFDTPFGKYERLLDKLVIYGSTIVPMVYWHTHLPRSFHWFVEGDFLGFNFELAWRIFALLYLVLLIAYAVKETRSFYTKGFCSVPKQLILMATLLSWWIGIVVLNNDIAFTILNVVSHGLPYMALVWFTQKRSESFRLAVTTTRSLWKKVTQPQTLIFYIGFLLLLAFIEEYLWGGLIWREHLGVFPYAELMPVLQSQLSLSIVVPMLSVPQITHYILDGFIWKVKGRNSSWAPRLIDNS